MANNPKSKEALQKEKLNETVSKTDQFFNENKKTIIGVLIAILVVGFGVLAYNQWVAKPKQAQAMEQMFPAEASFNAGEYALALNGDGNVLGFADIIDEYGAKGGKAVYAYAGICALQEGDFEQAISYLKKYKGKDNILSSRVLSCIGDAYVGLEDYPAAINYFMKAAAKADDIFAAASLLKAGVTYEELGQDDNALECYKQIKDQYPQSIEGYDIDKYIARIESK